jgi:organic hydroperoxide reductase OsmC/OhrA
MAESRGKTRSWQYANTVTWKDGQRAVLAATGKPDVDVATPPEFGGPDGIWSPEDLLVAAVNSCILTTFLYLADKAKIELLRYTSEAEGTLVYTGGGLGFTEVIVRVNVTMASDEDREKARASLEHAEEQCLISNALNCAVRVEPTIRVSSA